MDSEGQKREFIGNLGVVMGSVRGINFVHCINREVKGKVRL